MKENIKTIIYLIGVVLFGLAYYPFKEALSAWLFVVVAISYLLIIRLLAEYIHKQITGKRETAGD